MEGKRMKIQDSRMREGFWRERQRLIADQVIYRQYEILNGSREGLAPNQYSNVLDCFRIAAGLSDSQYEGSVCSDSELGKWIEAAALSIRNFPDEKLAGLVEEIIGLLESAQEEDGYLNTYYQVLHPDRKFTQFAFSCELYNMGHLMEAAAVWYEVTKDRRLLHVMCKTADLLCSVFSEGQPEGACDGHPEIELGLLKLYRATGLERYRKLALAFVRERGRRPGFFLEEQHLGGIGKERPDRWFGPDHHLAHRWVADQREADGHAVKLCYLYTAVTELILEGELSEEIYGAAVDAIWENMVRKRMYVTGGIGSQAYAERFTRDYDLPSERGYLETCASVGVCLWAEKMLDYHRESEYADVYEWELYNGVLAGWSLDGNRYHYANTLHCRKGITDYRQDCVHVEVQRQPWFACACCPSNLLRLIGNLAQDCIRIREGVVYVDLYMSAQVSIKTQEGQLDICMETRYPYEGEISLTIGVGTEDREEAELALRIPAWCRNYAVRVNGENISDKVRKGYVHIRQSWKDGDCIRLSLAQEYRFLYADGHLWEQSGKAVLTKGPLVYCIEGTDNEEPSLLYYWTGTKFTESVMEIAGQTIPTVRCTGFRQADSAGLYRFEEPEMKAVELTAIPYFAWGNRGETDMDVWIPYRSTLPAE